MSVDKQQTSAPARSKHVGKSKYPYVTFLLWLSGTLSDFSHLLAPVSCAACGHYDCALCPRCSKALRMACREPFRAEEGADALMGVDATVRLPCMSAGQYKGELAASIIEFKNHGRTELALLLAKCLLNAVSRAVQEFSPTAATMSRKTLYIVPIPSTAAGWRKRGYDPLSMLWEQASLLGAIPPDIVHVELLRSRFKAPWKRRLQKGLGRAARRRNMRGSLRLRSSHFQRKSCPPPGAPILLIDDVLTTGSTLSEAHRVLRLAGYNVVGSAVLAAAQKP